MRLTPYMIFELLPKTNCKECGFQTCLGLAMDLAARKVELSQCPYLSPEAKASLHEDAALSNQPAISGSGIESAQDKRVTNIETAMPTQSSKEWRGDGIEFRPPGDSLTQREEAVTRREAAADQKERELRLWQERLFSWQKRLQETPSVLGGKSEEINLEQLKVKRVAEALERREENCKRIEETLKEARQRIKALRADLHERDEQIKRQETTITSQKRQLGLKANQIKELQAKGDQISNFKIQDRLILDWMTEETDPSHLDLPPRLVTVGSGPFPRKDFKQFLGKNGYKLCSLGDEEVEIMVVGRTDWTEEELENQIAAWKGDTLKIYSQEMFIAALAIGRDPFETANEKTLFAFGRGHPALEYLMKTEFKWPSTEPPGGGNGEAPVNLQEESPLSHKGYTAGKSGLGRKERHRILGEAFEDELPWVGSDEYMAQWGKANTRKRLRRIAHHIAWLIRFHQSNPSMSNAIRDWESDLAWLEETYYTPRMHFTWPNTVV